VGLVVEVCVVVVAVIVVVAARAMASRLAILERSGHLDGVPVCVMRWVCWVCWSWGVRAVCLQVRRLRGWWRRRQRVALVIGLLIVAALHVAQRKGDALPRRRRGCGHAWLLEKLELETSARTNTRAG
jgi:hypothetical protein